MHRALTDGALRGPAGDWRAMFEVVHDARIEMESAWLDLENHRLIHAPKMISLKKTK